MLSSRGGKQHFEGWEYPARGAHSKELRCDESGEPLRIKGLLLKKGGSRRSASPMMLMNRRRNWSSRWFYLDLNAATMHYYLDESLKRKVGEVRFLPGAQVQIPEEVKLRGRHAPDRPNAPVHYFELTHTADMFGKRREAPFAIRATSKDEFTDWIRSLTYCVKSVGAGTAVITISNDRPGSMRYDQDDCLEDQDDITAPSSPPASGPPPRIPSFIFQEALDDLNEESADSQAYSSPENDDSKIENYDQVLPHSASVEPRLEDQSPLQPQPKLIRQRPISQIDLIGMEYYYQHKVTGDTVGPFEITDLRRLWKEGTSMNSSTFIYLDYLEEWVILNQVPALFRLLSPPHPPPPRPAAHPPPPPPPLLSSSSSATTTTPAPSNFEI